MGRGERERFVQLNLGVTNSLVPAGPGSILFVTEIVGIVAEILYCGWNPWYCSWNPVCLICCIVI